MPRWTTYQCWWYRVMQRSPMGLRRQKRDARWIHFFKIMYKSQRHPAGERGEEASFCLADAFLADYAPLVLVRRHFTQPLQP